MSLLDYPDTKQYNSLDGCRFVYLDVGTNIGIQIRKLFEPDLYPNAKIHKIFNKYFGKINTRLHSGLCAVGFEPNPNHSPYLQSKKKTICVIYLIHISNIK